MMKKLRQLVLKVNQITNRFNSQYTKFIILSRSRTGSNLLKSMLNSHPLIETKGEVFSQLNDSVEKKIQTIFGPRPKHLKAVGFKIFYNHPNNIPNEEVWKTLQKLEGLKVIHLKRRNILRTVLSNKIAGKTGLWAEKKDHKNKLLDINQKKCSFTYDELVELFEQTEKWQEEGSKRFVNNEVIEIYYEDLIQNPKFEFKKIIELFKIDWEDLEQGLRKQNPEKLSELIENYSSLKHKFRDTKWSVFFEE